MVSVFYCDYVYDRDNVLSLLKRLKKESSYKIYWNASLRVYLNVSIWKPVNCIIVC